MKINKNDYTNFIKQAKYDYENKIIGAENGLYFGKSIEEFCDRQKEKFEKQEENKYGCCLNYSLYLLSNERPRIYHTHWN